MDIINLKHIKQLLNSDIASYTIGNDSGVPRQTISSLRRGDTKLENMSLKNIIKLQSYINKGETNMLNIISNLELKLVATNQNEDITDACMDKLTSDIQQYNDDIADVDDEMLIDILEEYASSYTDNKYTINFTVFKIDGEYRVIHESDYYEADDNYSGEATITIEVV